MSRIISYIRRRPLQSLAAALLCLFGLYMGVALIGYNVLSLPISKLGTFVPTSPFENVSFQSRGQSYQVNGFFVAGNPSAPALITVPGYRDNRRTEHFSAMNEALHGLGYTVLSIDLNASGGDTPGTGRISMGFHERYDILGAFDYLLTRGFAADHIGLVGESMGAASVMMAAALEPRLKAIWEDSGYGQVSTLLGENAQRSGFPPLIIPGGMVWAYLLAGDRLWEINPVEVGPTLAANKQAVYIAHGDNDHTVPYHHGVDLNNAFKAAGVDVTFWTEPGLDHVQGLLKMREDYLKRLTGFFGSHLAGTI